ncbi:MAG TPA: hypothetical protein VL463_15520 [Kofleriaceae bacterium]|jgi:hypothetical protein|nr:hypothetical protein [Kofleriaceae bacterium]
MQVRDKLDATERAARQLGDACFAAWDALINGSGAVASRNAHAVMDASYVASTTARLIAHADQYQLHMIAMQIAVCRRVASRCATICKDHPDPTVNACARVARAAVASCNDVLRLLWDGALAAAAADDIEDEGSGETSVA